MLDKSHTTKLFKAQLALCSDILYQLQQSIIKQQWHMLAEHTQAYEKGIAKLQQIIAQNSPIPTIYQKQFVGLHYNQRRIMRLIHQAQQKTKDAIASADKGISKVNKLSALTH